MWPAVWPGSRPAGRCRRRTGRTSGRRSRTIRRPPTRSRPCASRRRGRTGGPVALHPPAGAGGLPLRARTDEGRLGELGDPLAWSEWRCVIPRPSRQQARCRARAAEPDTACSGSDLHVLDHAPGDAPERPVGRDHDRRVEARVHEQPRRPLGCSTRNATTGTSVHSARGTPSQREERREPALLPVQRGSASTKRPHRSGRSRTVAPGRPPGSGREAGRGSRGGRHRSSPYPAVCGSRLAPGAGPADRLGYARAMPARRHPLAPGARLPLLALAAPASGRRPAAPPDAAAARRGDLTNADRCDFLDPAQCLFPWPNDYFTVPTATPTRAGGLELPGRLDAGQQERR